MKNPQFNVSWQSVPYKCLSQDTRVVCALESLSPDTSRFREHTGLSNCHVQCIMADSHRRQMVRK